MFEPLWGMVIRARRAGRALPMLEAILAGFGTEPPGKGAGGPAARPFAQAGGHGGRDGTVTTSR
jgi:hypothetical protein